MHQKLTGHKARHRTHNLGVHRVTQKLEAAEATTSPGEKALTNYTQMERQGIIQHSHKNVSVEMQ